MQHMSTAQEPTTQGKRTQDYSPGWNRTHVLTTLLSS